jgi:GTPase SAR1 family protein
MAQSEAQAKSDARAGKEVEDVGKGSVLPVNLPRATSIIVIGMAGSGKSTFTTSLQSYPTNHPGASVPYFVNLDPAVTQTSYSANVDIRDTIDYQRLMQEYNLGPNGGILTALNLFTTKFDQVLGILEKRSNDVDHIILDTPGQIEIFTWSASGTIITDSLATSMPTVVAYIIDTPRTLAPATFMSNMLYACSIMYKTKLPFILVFNKIDLQSHQFALDWMKDFELFQEALKGGSNPTEPIQVNSMGGQSAMKRGNGEDGSYMNSLMNSMALVLDEFYGNLRVSRAKERRLKESSDFVFPLLSFPSNIQAVGVSSTTGEGLADFYKAVEEARKEYVDDYRPELEKVVQERADKKEKEKKAQLDKMMRDMKLAKGKGGKEVEGEGEDDNADLDPSYDGDGQLLDPVSGRCSRTI